MATIALLVSGTIDNTQKHGFFKPNRSALQWRMRGKVRELRENHVFLMPNDRKQTIGKVGEFYMVVCPNVELCIHNRCENVYGCWCMCRKEKRGSIINICDKRVGGQLSIFFLNASVCLFIFPNGHFLFGRITLLPSTASKAYIEIRDFSSVERLQFTRQWRYFLLVVKSWFLEISSIFAVVSTYLDKCSCW